MELRSWRESKQVSWSVMVVLSHVFISLILAGDNSLSSDPTSMEDIESLSLSTASSKRPWQTVRASFTLGSLVREVSLEGMSLESLESSLMATCKESLKRTSGSVVFAVSKEEMLEKHEFGYRVTLHTALSEAAGVTSVAGTELDEGDDELFRLCIMVPASTPMIRANRTMEPWRR